MTTPTMGVATLPVVRALLDEARRGNYLSGVLGVRARPQWTGAGTFDHEGVSVTVVPCVSTLAMRDALRQRDEDKWVVILTDRDDADLGAGLRSHLVWHRLRTPDPWDAVQNRFAASGLDPALTTGNGHRDLAAGLLACTPAEGNWPPAPGGVLTRSHAFASVATRYLRLSPPYGPAEVLTWTAQPQSAALVGDLRALAGDTLTDAVLEWAARHVGSAGPLLVSLLRSGRGREAIPVGLVLDALLEARGGTRPADTTLAQVALARLEPRSGGAAAQPGSLESWAGQASQLVTELLRERPNVPLAQRLLAEADKLLAEVQAGPLAEGSTLLPAGLDARLARLGAALRSAATVTAAHDGDQAVVPVDELAAVEAAWSAVGAHALADEDARMQAFAGAVRLTRWLAADVTSPATSLLALQRRYLDADAWVDSAVNDAAPGVGNPELGAALAAVLSAVRIRRDRHDVQYAAALAAHTADESVGDSAAVPVEDLLAQSVLPVASRVPVLLLVLDGMSAAVGLEIIASVVAKVADGWVEALPQGESRRGGAVAVLPSITEVSRASLLSGELCRGSQDDEQRGYGALTRAHGLAGARLFHKKPLDSSQLGFAVADDVGAAIDDQRGQPLVTCILNTIDDALDRSDPAGTVWTAEAVKHLSPLLDRARLAGRVVVLTSDHGHIVERRQGTQRSYPVVSSGRSRAEGPTGTGELLVAGTRVLLHDGRAVLAVDERLRYGPLKAGYHGGAAPAEVVVPVYFLVPGGRTEGTGLVAASPQEPAWWLGPVGSVAPTTLVVTQPPEPRPTPTTTPTLFDPPGIEPEPPAVASPLPAAVVRSSVYAEQRTLAGRVSITDQQLSALLTGLLAAPSRRLPPTAAALAVGVAPSALRGAVLHAQRLLNVEGYAVLRFDADGATVVLDEAALREQFELSP